MNSEMIIPNKNTELLTNIASFWPNQIVISSHILFHFKNILIAKLFFGGMETSHPTQENIFRIEITFLSTQYETEW